MASPTSSALLDIRDLRLSSHAQARPVELLRGIDLQLAAGQTLALVGESGCGKSLTAHTIMGLLAKRAALSSSGRVLYRGQNLLELPESAYRRLRGRAIALIPQNPMNSFNPCMRIGEQIAEVLALAGTSGPGKARAGAIALLSECGIRDAGRRARQYPHEFSGGMLQRAMIAMALAGRAELLIADEPTTALDVITQAQIIALLRSIQQQRGTAILFITHDLKLVASFAQRVAIMYAGSIVEQGQVEDMFSHPAHPYNEGLQQSLPVNRAGGHSHLRPIGGSPPAPGDTFSGCAFVARCKYRLGICTTKVPPPLRNNSSQVSCCWLLHEQASDNHFRNPQAAACHVD